MQFSVVLLEIVVIHFWSSRTLSLLTFLTIDRIFFLNFEFLRIQFIHVLVGLVLAHDLPKALDDDVFGGIHFGFVDVVVQVIFLFFLLKANLFKHLFLSFFKRKVFVELLTGISKVAKKKDFLRKVAVYFLTFLFF